MKEKSTKKMAMIPKLTGQLDFEGRQRAVEISDMDFENPPEEILGYMLAEREQQLEEAHKRIADLQKPQIWGALVDKIPTLTTEPHEICEPYTSEEVVNMWDILKSRCQLLEDTLSMFMDRMHRFGAWEDGCFYYNRFSASELLEPMEQAEGLLK